MEKLDDIETTLQDTTPLSLSILEFKKQLDPSASYVIAEKPSSRYGHPDLSAFSELAVAFRKLTQSRRLIYDASIGKLILVIKLMTTVDDQFFADVIRTNLHETMKVYLYRNR